MERDMRKKIYVKPRLFKADVTLQAVTASGGITGPVKKLP
jgi:hypothetical protein